LGLDLVKLAGELRRGRDIPPTVLEDNACRALIYFSFPTLLPFTKKRLAISAVDGAGELQKYLFRPLVAATGRPDIEKVMNDLRGRNITEDDCEQFFSSILDSDAFLFAVDGDQAYKELDLGGEPIDKSYPYQEIALAQFAQNITAYKKLNNSSPRPRGFGLLITKTDKIVNVMDEKPDTKKLEEFTGEYLRGGWSAMSSLCHCYRIQPNLFYHRLHPLKSKNPNDPKQKYEIEKSPGRSMIKYPVDQYDAIIDWFNSLA